ncbi:olfactory receptor 13F1-like [Discoglossus pictus]
MYLLSVLGNLIIISLIGLVSQLHTPMYFFLSNLSALDIIYVSTLLPKLLAMTVEGNTRISFSGCITQISLFGLCIDTEFILLTTMAYDRYVAICIPLRYYLIMNTRKCLLLITSSWVFGLLNSLIYSLLVSRLTFCKTNYINSFFCDGMIMLKLSCSDTIPFKAFLPVEAVLLGLFPFMLILTSYISIISTILKMKTSTGRLKMFSSCSSHLTVVIMFYGSSLILNLKPKSELSQEQDKLLSILYIGVVPMLNPLVYSLRNKEVMKAMQKCFHNHKQNRSL